MPINAGTRIPPRSRLRRSIRSHGEQVFLAVAKANMGRQIVAKTHIAIWPLADGMPVDPDFTVRHHAVKLNEHVSFLVASNGKLFSIPPDPRWQKRAVATGRRGRLERS